MQSRVFGGPRCRISLMSALCFECLLPMLTARNVAELAAAQAGWVNPVNNLVCADVQGKIAYQCRGESSRALVAGAPAAAGARLGRGM